MRALRLHPAALAELDAAGEWYDEQMPGLSLELIAEVHDALELIQANPQAWQGEAPVGRRDVRRFVMRRFPFAIVYAILAEEIEVLAVAHFRRKPGYWRGRL